MTVDFEEYYNRYGAMVLRRCRAMLKNEDLALDAMQETFVNFLKKGDINIEYPSSFLYKIATNVCLNMMRKDKRTVLMDNEVLYNIASTEEIEEKFIINEMLNSIFIKEKISTRVIAVMHYIDGMTLQEVSDEVGLSVSGIRKRLRNLKINAVEQYGE